MAHFLTSTPIDAAELVASVTGPARGGVVSFLGVVRDRHADRQVLRLEYSAYEAMAEAECARIAAEAEGRWPVKTAVRHRVGPLAVGDVAVVAVAAAEHRAEAFEACRYLIEELKRRVPVWKKEFYGDGTVAWVDPTAGGEADRGTSPELAGRPQ
jgi:molybdopterin synthase catalytic subunit